MEWKKLKLHLFRDTIYGKTPVSVGKYDAQL